MEIFMAAGAPNVPPGFELNDTDIGSPSSGMKPVSFHLPPVSVEPDLATQATAWAIRRLILPGAVNARRSILPYREAAECAPTSIGGIIGDRTRVRFDRQPPEQDFQSGSRTQPVISVARVWNVECHKASSDIGDCGQLHGDRREPPSNLTMMLAPEPPRGR